MIKPRKLLTTIVLVVVSSLVLAQSALALTYNQAFNKSYTQTYNDCFRFGCVAPNFRNPQVYGPYYNGWGQYQWVTYGEDLTYSGCLVDKNVYDAYGNDLSHSFSFGC